MIFCPICENEMIETQATHLGDHYWYCRTCKKELGEIGKPAFKTEECAFDCKGNTIHNNCQVHNGLLTKCRCTTQSIERDCSVHNKSLPRTQSEKIEQLKAAYSADSAAQTITTKMRAMVDAQSLSISTEQVIKAHILDSVYANLLEQWGVATETAERELREMTESGATDVFKREYDADFGPGEEDLSSFQLPPEEQTVEEMRPNVKLLREAVNTSTARGVQYVEQLARQAGKRQAIGHFRRGSDINLSTWCPSRCYVSGTANPNCCVHGNCRCTPNSNYPDGLSVKRECPIHGMFVSD